MTKVVYDCETGTISEEPHTPDEEAVMEATAAHGKTQAMIATQAASDDTERLRVINERARTDPAYAALADMVLRGVSR